MTKLAYNNAKNVSIGHTPFELNYSYYLYVFFTEDINSLFWLKKAVKLSAKL